jgi:hypothetical protein
MPIRSVRAVGFYLLNLVVAVIGTKVVEDPFDRFVHFSERTSVVVLKADFLTSIVAFALGYLVYRRWQPASAGWAWVAGACWFGLGALHILGGRQGTMLWEISRSPFPLDINSFVNWSKFTVPLLRTIFYSAGAFCCSHIEGQRLTMIKDAMLRKSLISPTDHESGSAK